MTYSRKKTLLAAAVILGLALLAGAALVYRYWYAPAPGTEAYVPTTLLGTVVAVQGTTLDLAVTGPQAGPQSVYVASTTQVFVLKLLDEKARAANFKKFQESQTLQGTTTQGTTTPSEAPPASTFDEIPLSSLKPGLAVSVSIATSTVGGLRVVYSVLVLPSLPGFAAAPSTSK